MNGPTSSNSRKLVRIDATHQIQLSFGKSIEGAVTIGSLQGLPVSSGSSCNVLARDPLPNQTELQEYRLETMQRGDELLLLVVDPRCKSFWNLLSGISVPGLSRLNVRFF